MTLQQTHAQYRRILAQATRDGCRQDAVRKLAEMDLFFFLRYVLHREDADHEWVYARCREYQAAPDGYLDLWWREGYKSTIITFAGIIWNLIHDPERTYLILSYVRPIAKSFLRQIKQELQNNEELKELWPDIFWQNPKKEAPKWSEDDGIIIKRKGNPKESTIEAYGLTDGQPTSKHSTDVHYEDIVTLDTVRTEGMLTKTTDAFLYSLNLGVRGGRRRGVGSTWHFNDAHAYIVKNKILVPRIWTATKNNKFDGEPWMGTREELAKKIADMGPYIASAQLFMDPVHENLQGFDRAWLRYWKADRFTGLNIYILVDPASGKKKNNDYTVFIVMGLGSDRNYYILHWIRDRLSLVQKANVLFSLHQRYRPRDVGYEQYGMQADIEHFQDRMNRDNYRFGITPLGGPLGKDDRIRRLVPPFNQGRVYIPENTPYVQYDGVTVDLTRQFIDDEYLAFPYCVHDDMLDDLSRIMDPDFSAVFPQGKEHDPLNLEGRDEIYDPLRHGL